MAGILVALALGLVGTLIFAVGEAEQRRLADKGKQVALFQAYRARVAAALAALQGHDVVAAAYELDGAPPSLRDWEWQHLRSRLDDSFALFQAPPGGDLFAISGPDGLRLVSAGRRASFTPETREHWVGSASVTARDRIDAKIVMAPGSADWITGHDAIFRGGVERHGCERRQRDGQR